MKSLAIALSAGLLVAPAAAQDAPKLVSIMKVPDGIDKARLAAAEPVAEKLMPPGTYKKMMGPAMDVAMSSVTQSMDAMPVKEIAQIGGLSDTDAAALGNTTMAQVMAIYDPHWQERMTATMHAMTAAMTDFMTGVEPELRGALVQAYAAHYTVDELQQLDTFFKTPTGAKYAAQSMTIMTDPIMMKEMQNLMPRMMKQMPAFIDAAQKATADMPPPRKIEDMTPDQKAELGKLLGVAPDKLQDPKTTP